MIPKNKRIAILHPYMDKVGGAIKMMIFLANFLKEKGNDVCFFTTSYDEKKFSSEVNFEIKVYSKIKISYEIRKFDYIIIGNSPMQFVGVLSKILFLSKAKILWWHHHYPWYYSENKGFKIFFKKYLEKFSLKFIDLLIGNSLYIQKSLLEIYKINKNKIQILNPVVDLEFLEQKINKNKNFESKTIITYSRWVEGKNVKQIFDTYEFLISNLQNFKLLIGGEGKELEFYKKKYKGNQKIKFLGFLDKKQIISNLEKADLFLFPSLIDSFGISALESICLGVPVIAFEGKGVNEIVKNGYNGYLVSNSEEFLEKTLKVLKDKNKKMFDGCIKTKEKFTYQRFEEQLENIFGKLS